MSDQGSSDLTDRPPDPESPAPESPAPEPPAPAVSTSRWAGSDRVEQLEAWFSANRARYTDVALGRSAEASGYSAEEIKAAWDLAAARDHARVAIAPIRTRARWVILAAYGIVWLLFAYAYLIRPTNFGAGPILQGILTMSMLIALGVSAAVIAALRPDPDRAGRALAILLVIPVVLLVGVAGLCLPFVGTA